MREQQDQGNNLLKKKNHESGGGKFVVLLSLAVVGIAVITGFIVFSLSLEGAEQILVPDVTGSELSRAVIDLQEKALNTRVQLHYSSNPEEKGTVLGQTPEPGAQVKAGSNIILKVSRGAVIDKVEDYVGWKLDDLEIHLQTMFTTYGPLLRIGRPVVRVFDEAEPGTILEQKPTPGTKITGVTDLELVVSKGPQAEMEIVDNYIGLDFQQAVERLVERDIPFTFDSFPPEEDEEPGTVISQVPDPGESVEMGTFRQLQMVEPVAVPEGRVFGILRRSFPEYPIFVDLKVEAITTEGIRSEVLSMKFPGGELAIPYIAEENTLLIVSIFDNEIFRYTVRPKEIPEEE